MKPWFALALAVLLSGCAETAADVPPGWLAVIEAEQAKAPAPPAECSTKGDPKWLIPNAGEEPMPDTARRERKNKTAFEELATRRRICADAQLRSAPAPPAVAAKK